MEEEEGGGGVGGEEGEEEKEKKEKKKEEEEKEEEEKKKEKKQEKEKKEEEKKKEKKTCNAAASVQTNRGCCDILHVQEYLTIDDRQEEAPGTVIDVCEKGAFVSKTWLVNCKTGINLHILY